MVSFDLTPSHLLEWKQWLFEKRWALLHGCTGIVGVVVLVIGLAVLSYQPDAPSVSQVTAQGLPAPKIQVYVSGAVQQPGVFSLDQGQRLSDLLAAAGGVSDQVDPLALSSQLNLATKLADGEHIHIPLLAESLMQPSPQPLVSEELLEANTDLTTISLNTATAAELMELPQIGEKRAMDIIAGRPYTTVGELLDKEVVTEKMFAAIKDLISL